MLVFRPRCITTVDFANRTPPQFAKSLVEMERKLSGSKPPYVSPPGSVAATAEPPDSDSARSTPDAGPEARGAIPKTRSTGKLDALRSSLREVGKSSSFKIKRNKQERNETDEKKTGKEEKKLKKGKKKDQVNSPPQVEKVVGVDEGTLVTSPLQPSKSSETLSAKASKVSKASSLVRKLSIGRYRDRGKNPLESPSNKALSPTSTSPELSPTASRTDVSEDDAPSVTSSASEGRQGPEGDDGARPPSTAERRSVPFEPTSPPLSPPAASQPPPPATGLGQSRLIGSGFYKGLSDQSEAPSSRSAATVAVTTSAIATAVVRQPLESTTPRKDRDPTLETVHEDQADDDYVSSQPSPLEAERSPPATPAFHSAFTSLDEATPLQESTAPGSSRAATAAYMSQRLGASTAADAAATKSQILSITTPALKKQQALEEIRAASAAAVATAAPPDPNPVTASAERPPSAHASDDREDDQFGDVEDDTATSAATTSHAAVMSAPPPSAATAMAEARARLSQSLGGSADEASAQPVNEKREHLYKILVIGELGTGKTSIIKRYVHQFFSQHYRATIGVDFALKVLNWDANTVIRLQLWDIAGQERFGNMTRVYYKEAVGAFIVFDVTRAATFDAVIKWKQDLDAKVQLADGSPIPCVLLANKCDQQKEGIVNNVARMDEYCRERGFSAWFETSAKENINIEDAARCLVTKILQNDKLIHNDNGKDNDKFALDSKAQKDEKSGKSCAC